ncbi:hypothetical protein FRC04_011777 [Tulasnella sp. 424]|nr:hypothetical protein FRC04_011777 [Tulasnella sp. 424]
MEEQPLIPNKRQPTPLPKGQLGIILFARFAEPIAYTQIFPYIAQMVEELHIASDKKKIGFYAGLILLVAVDGCKDLDWKPVRKRRVSHLKPQASNKICIDSGLMKGNAIHESSSQSEGKERPGRLEF